MKMSLNRPVALCVASMFLTSGVVHAAGLDEIPADVAKRLYALGPTGCAGSRTSFA